MIEKLLEFLFGIKKKEDKPRDLEWEKFQKNAREQFVKLNKKGLNIPVITI